MVDTAPISATAITAANSTNKKDTGSWYEAMAEAWGKALDKQADKILELSAGLEEGGDTPSKFNQFTAESLRMGIISNASHTSLTSVASALETMARKQ